MSDQHLPSPERASNAPPPDRTTPESPRRLIAGLGVCLIIAIATVAILWTRRAASAAAETTRRDSSMSHGSVVRTVSVTRSGTSRQLELLGEARPFASVTLYAKVGGYLKAVNVDMGDRVTGGEVLATIESPETDRALLGAKADYENKALQSKRVDQLLERKLVSPQEADQARTEAAIARERLGALTEQQAYETLRAPFSGVVTARFADPGALLQSAASSQTSALPVVTVSQTDRLRVFIYLDQGDAAVVRRGTPAEITLAERSGVRIPATVARVSGQLDPKTRKMQAELDVDDRSGVIVPGSFVQVVLAVAITPQLQAPVGALIVRGGKTMVAVVGPDASIELRPVTVAGNDGRTLTFGGGVNLGDRLALNIGSGGQDGMHVQIDSSPVAASGDAKASSTPIAGQRQ